MGRPVKLTEEKIRMLENLCRHKLSMADCGEILELNPSTIEKWIRKTHDCTFSEYRSKKMSKTRLMIINGILEKCRQGNMVALIYASKNLCGWSDNNQVEQSGSLTINYEGVERDD
jgi:YesN/AraC family two-component response regulator